MTEISAEASHSQHLLARQQERTHSLGAARVLISQGEKEIPAEHISTTKKAVAAANDIGKYYMEINLTNSMIASRVDPAEILNILQWIEPKTEGTIPEKESLSPLKV